MPFNLQMGKVLMKYATAQLLTMIKDRNGDHYFFFVPDGMKAEYFFDAATVKGGFRFNPVAAEKYVHRTGQGWQASECDDAHGTTGP